MQTVSPAADISEDRPRVTPEWAALVELGAAEYGLPPEPWPLP